MFLCIKQRHAFLFLFLWVFFHCFISLVKKKIKKNLLFVNYLLFLVKFYTMEISIKQEMSVTQYADLKKITRQGVLLQIKEKRLPDNVTAKKIGNVYILTVS